MESVAVIAVGEEDAVGMRQLCKREAAMEALAEEPRPPPASLPASLIGVNVHVVDTQLAVLTLEDEGAAGAVEAVHGWDEAGKGRGVEALEHGAARGLVESVGKVVARHAAVRVRLDERPQRMHEHLGASRHAHAQLEWHVG